MALHDFGRRAIAAARLDPAIYEEVEHDPGATSQALLIVLLAGLGTAIGQRGRFESAALVAGMIVAVLGWAIWAGLCLVIGTRLLPEPQTKADAGELLRVLGFAAVPGVAQALGILPPLRTPVLALAQTWTILTMIVAVRQALDYTSTARAVVVCVAGWTVQLVVTVALLAALGPALARRPVVAARRSTETAPTAGYVGVVKPSGVAPPVQ